MDRRCRANGSAGCLCHPTAAGNVIPWKWRRGPLPPEVAPLQNVLNAIAGSVAAPTGRTLTVSRFLLLFVDQEIRAAINTSQAGRVNLTETQVLGWRAILSNVVTRLNLFLASTAVPLSAQPPAQVTLIQLAINQINAALATLESINFVAPLIFPPQPGQATVPVSLLVQVENNVSTAARAVEQAERLVGAG